MRSITKPHLPSDFVRVDDLADDRPREAASLVGLGMGRANPRFDCTAPQQRHFKLGAGSWRGTFVEYTATHLVAVLQPHVDAVRGARHTYNEVCNLAGL